MLKKRATILLLWNQSPSTDVKEVRVEIEIAGLKTVNTYPGRDTDEATIQVFANQSFNYKVVTVNHDGLETSSVTYSYTLGDLEAPAPATDLDHRIIAVEDVDDGSGTGGGGTGGGTGDGGTPAPSGAPKAKK